MNWACGTGVGGRTHSREVDGRIHWTRTRSTRAPNPNRYATVGTTPERTMGKWKRRMGYYLLALLAIMLAYSLAYHYGMVYVEGTPVTYLHSLQVVVETFTTTGFGSDSPWQTPMMNVLVIAMDLTGVLMIFLALPALVFPLFEETLSTVAPTEVSDREAHVVICGYTPRTRALIGELDARDVPYAVVEPDRDRAAEIYEEEPNVIHADPETEQGLVRASAGRAQALVADIDDETNASIALAADQLDGADADILTLVEDSMVADYHRYAGADHAFSPRQLVGESLARQVTVGITPEVSEVVEIGDDFEIAELPVQTGSDLTGRTVADSGIRERTGVNVIGAWFRGEFASPPPPDARIDDQTILVVAGHEQGLERLKDFTRSERRHLRPDRVIVAGHDEVGSTVRAAIEDRLDAVVVDLEDEDGVDVVGDATDTETLERAGIHEASTVILALSDDTETVFATLVVRELDPEVEILARAGATESVEKLYRAGADYVLALSTVSGRMLAATVFEEDVLRYDQQVEVLRTDAGTVAGQTLAEANVRAETGCTIIAVERDGEVVTDLGPESRIRDGDDLVVVGTDADVSSFAAMVEE